MSAADEVLASRVRHFREQIADRKVEITLDREDLEWMVAVEGMLGTDASGAEGEQKIAMTSERIDLFATAIAAVRILTERDSTFWPRLRKLGPTPEIVREANNILRWRTVNAADALSALDANPVFHALTRRRSTATHNRGRAARRPCNARTRGSRRTSSRSAGGGSSGDDDGEPAPSRLTPRWLHPDSHRLAEAGGTVLLAEHAEAHLGRAA